jgi:hypothetical protein
MGLLAIQVAALVVLALVIYLLARRARPIVVKRSPGSEVPAGVTVATAVPGLQAVSDHIEMLTMTGTPRVVIQCPGPDPLVTIVARDPAQIRALIAAIDEFLGGSSEQPSTASRSEPATFR